MKKGQQTRRFVMSLVSALDNSRSGYYAAKARPESKRSIQDRELMAYIKRERVNRTRYRTRDEARADIFDYIEVFYNRKRRHAYLGNVSPVDFEKRSAKSLETVH